MGRQAKECSAASINSYRLPLNLDKSLDVSESVR